MTSTAMTAGTATARWADPTKVHAVLNEFVSPYPFEWPMHALTDAQVQEAKDCDIPGLVDARYGDSEIADFESVFEPTNSCDWATLAAAYVYQADEDQTPVAETGRTAFLKAIADNPAFKLKNELFFGFFEPGHLVKSPPQAESAVETAILTYTFGGIGYGASTYVIIDDANRVPRVSGIVTESEWDAGDSQRSLSGTIDIELVQALGQSLTDLVPIDTRFYAIACYDYYPSWEVTLVFADGRSIKMETEGNFLGGGGPWETTIDGQPYIQGSGAFPTALSRISEFLELPGGATAAMACYPAGDMLEYGFPLR